MQKVIYDRFFHFLVLSLNLENIHFFCKTVEKKYSENMILDFFSPGKMQFKFHMQKDKGLGTK